MEKIENNLIPFWNKLRKKAKVSIEDWNGLEKLLGTIFDKIHRQRERLEQSRDMWKNKYMKLKSEKEVKEK